MRERTTRPCVRIAVANAATLGASDPTRNEEKRDVLRAMVERASREGVSLLVLPAGYFVVDNAQNISRVLDPLIDELMNARLAVVLGVDAIPTSGGGAWPRCWDAHVRARSLPFFALAWTPTMGIRGPWRQRSTSRNDQHLIPDDLAAQVRTIEVNASEIAVMLCGEIFNARIREAHAAHRQLHAVVDIGHSAAGWRVHAGLSVFSRLPGADSALACSHAAGWDTLKHWYLPGAVRASSRAHDLWVEGPPWLSAAIFEV